MRMLLDQVLCCSGQTCHVLPLILSRCIVKAVRSRFLVLLLPQNRWALMTGDLLIPTPKVPMVTWGCVNSFSASLVLSPDVLGSQLYCYLHLAKLNFSLPGLLDYPSQHSFQCEFLSLGWLEPCSCVEPSSHQLVMSHGCVKSCSGCVHGPRRHFPLEKASRWFVFEFLVKWLCCWTLNCPLQEVRIVISSHLQCCEGILSIN